MTAYRFCRTDDMALLVAAFEGCRGPEHDAVPALDLAGFKALVRELDLWCSSSMVAFEGREPVGVLLGAKRAASTLVYGLRVHPDHRRRGHGRHLLTSLGQKLAILGPPSLVAEVPADDIAAIALFTACGWQAREGLRDWRREPPATPSVLLEHDGLSRMTFQELCESSVLAQPVAAWARALAALERRSARLAAVALHSPERLEAWALFERRPAPQPWRMLRMGCESGVLGVSGLTLVVEDVARQAGAAALVFERACSTELAPERLAALGFSPGAVHSLFTAEAKAA